MNNNRIARQLADYLDYKRSLGFKLTSEATVLKRFVNYTVSIGYDGQKCRYRYFRPNADIFLMPIFLDICCSNVSSLQHISALII